MTTLIFDWSDWDGPASGHVVVTRRTWRRAPESLHVPWQVVVPVDGRATLDVAHVAGEAVSILWAPRRMASRTDHVLIPDGGEHLAHLLDRVDPSTLEPLEGEDAVTAADALSRAVSAVASAEEAVEASAGAFVARDEAVVAAERAGVSAVSAGEAAARAEAAAVPGLGVVKDSDLNLILTPLNGANIDYDAVNGVLILEVAA